MWVLKIRKGVVQGHLDPQILSGKDLKKKRRKSALFMAILDSKSDHLATFLTKKVWQLVDLDEVGTFGVNDSILQLDDEVKEGIDGANESKLWKKKEMLISYLFVSQLFMQL